MQVSDRQIAEPSFTIFRNIFQCCQTYTHVFLQHFPYHAKMMLKRHFISILPILIAHYPFTQLIYPFAWLSNFK